jgi:hypothetical protein
MMGFVSANTIPDPPTKGTVSSPCYNFLWTNYVDIVATNLTYNQALKDSSTSQVTRDIIYRLYIAKESGPFNYPENVEGVGVNAFTGLPYNTTTVAGDPACYVGPLPTGSRPAMIYRQFSNPKEIRWSKNQPVGQVTFEVYDDKGRCLADLFPAGGAGYYSSNQTANWNMTMLVSEN